MMTESECQAKNNYYWCKYSPTCSNNNCGPAVTTDVCSNISGSQTVMPSGYVADSSGNCVEDKCLNIEGIQANLPTGYKVENGICSLKDTGISVSGTVRKYTDSTNFPSSGSNEIDGATVSLFLSPDRKVAVASGKTSGEAFYSINNLSQTGTYGVNVSASGYLTICSSVNAPTTAANFTLLPIEQPNNALNNSTSTKPGGDNYWDCDGGRTDIKAELQSSLQCLFDRIRANTTLTNPGIKYTSFARCSNHSGISNGKYCHDIGLAADFVPQINGQDNLSSTVVSQFKTMAGSCKLRVFDETATKGHIHVSACQCVNGTTGNAVYDCSSAPKTYQCEF